MKYFQEKQLPWLAILNIRHKWHGRSVYCDNPSHCLMPHVLIDHDVVFGVLVGVASIH